MSLPDLPPKLHHCHHSVICLSIKIKTPQHILIVHCSPHYRRNDILAFGSWEFNDDQQCFESARQPDLIRYSGDRDLYVAGDLYENNIVTPAIIVAPSRRGNYQKETKKDVWPVKDDGDTKEPPADRRVRPKAVDEDLYKISPELLRTKPRRASPESLEATMRKDHRTKLVVIASNVCLVFGADQLS
ncbi:hypothetical protein E3N88_35694 [Mikania micrantha]|uniref:Uncharacterized protein n=1 Tax=Mikania micrantha TaxID=192012 RepID=A0A5N6M1M0_9ASTR|nr:hypothetical protein E3N88_35694 [Mikania micrantha]